MNVLVTGGAGYIGNHACVELLNAGHSVVVVDNLVSANAECLRRAIEAHHRKNARIPRNGSFEPRSSQ